jgi:uncharacterized protein YukE
VADEIQYDYESMDNAYENMKKIVANITQSCEDMTSDALAMLESNGGQYAESYRIKLDKLNREIEELNDEMSARAGRLQSRFDEMGHADIKLGDGF